MRIAIMQPYFFPYIGYFQLIRCVDKFIIYDDVNFIKKGWINRNRILINGAPQLITIPLKNASQNKLIRDTEISEDKSWKGKLLKTLEQSYKKAPQFPIVYPAIEKVIQAEYASIAALNIASIHFVRDYLELPTTIVPTSTVYANEHIKAQQRILDICLLEGAQTYVNPEGGMELYDRNLFEQQQIQLFFLKSRSNPYRQFGVEFHANLSILDALMFLDKINLRHKLEDFQLVSN